MRKIVDFKKQGLVGKLLTPMDDSVYLLYSLALRSAHMQGVFGNVNHYCQLINARLNGLLITLEECKPEHDFTKELDDFIEKIKSDIRAIRNNIIARFSEEESENEFVKKLKLEVPYKNIWDFKFLKLVEEIDETLAVYNNLYIYGDITIGENKQALDLVLPKLDEYITFLKNFTTELSMQAGEIIKEMALKNNDFDSLSGSEKSLFYCGDMIKVIEEAPQDTRG